MSLVRPVDGVGGEIHGASPPISGTARVASAENGRWPGAGGARERLRVAIAHDFMEAYGGAERVTQELAAAFPEAPVTAILGRESVAERMGVLDRFRSVLPPRRVLLRHYRLLAPGFPGLVRWSELDEADVLLTSSYAFAHAFRTRNRAPQVCYCHSPLRFAWTMTADYRAARARRRLGTLAFDGLAAAMRETDRRAARGVTRYATQSPFVAEQVRRFYGKEAEVIGAPVDCRSFRPTARPRQDFFLLCGRLVEPYKRMDIVLAAFARRPDLRLVVAGDGPAMSTLRSLASPNVEFTGWLEDRELITLMQHCAAAIFPSRDDFGLVPVEVMACGRPVLAFAGGGAMHTMVPGETGEFFARQHEDDVLAALRTFAPHSYDPVRIRNHAMRWDTRAFRSRVRDLVVATAAEAELTPQR